MDASSPSTSKVLHQTQLRKYFVANNGHEITTVVEQNTKSCQYDKTKERKGQFCLFFSVDLSATGSGSDDENISPSWHNETTMTISATPEKIKKRQLRKTKSVKKNSYTRRRGRRR